LKEKNKYYSINRKSKSKKTITELFLKKKEEEKAKSKENHAHLLEQINRTSPGTKINQIPREEKEKYKATYRLRESRRSPETKKKKKKPMNKMRETDQTHEQEGNT
jgi:hypothetical protein